MKTTDLKIDGQAVSGIGSAIALPDLRICLDIGVLTEASRQCRTVLITHGHIDHLGCIIQHAHVRTMMGMKKSRYVVPPHLIEPIHAMFEAWRLIQEDSERAEYELIPVAPGETRDLGKNLSVRAFATHHRIESQGYFILQNRRRLKKAYEGLTGPEIGDIARTGVSVNEFFTVPVAAYTGDTKASVLDAEPDLLKVDLLIMESTFIGSEQDPEFAQARGHVHLDELAERADRFENTKVLLVHFSARYDNERIREAVEALPEGLRQRASFLPV